MNLVPPSAGSELAAGLSSLCTMLWQERVSLEVILFKLVEEQLVAARGDARFLRLADEELREAAGILQENEVLRAAETQMVARMLGLPPDASLAEIAERADEPWPDLLLEHRDALRRLLVEIEGAVATDRRILLPGAEAARAALEQVGAPVGTYDAVGRRSARGHAWLFDRQT
jgi:hypothetical protein